MKVILSRKGFDSANGGIVSPILDDGTMISFPIPSNDSSTYNDLQYNGISYRKILDDLRYKGGEFCHVDPDLDHNRMVKKIENWQPAFGQIDSSATYLKNIGIQEGDLFLFFGNFHRVSYEDGTYKYVKKSGDFYQDNDLQVIWGYMQVGNVVDDPEEQKKLWWHPHSDASRVANKTNLIFTASTKLTFDVNKPGAALLPYNKKRVLTLENSNKATWKYNEIYDTEHVLSKRKNSAKNPVTGIYYAGIWQELGLMESEACFEWAKSIIE